MAEQINNTIRAAAYSLSVDPELLLKALPYLRDGTISEWLAAKEGRDSK